MLTNQSDNWFRNEALNTGASVRYSLEEARIFLKRAEQEYEKDQVYHLLKWVKMACMQAGIQLTDFLKNEGMTEEHINEIERIGYKSWAKIFLNYIRSWDGIVAVINSDTSVSFYANCVRMGIRHGNWTLEGIGTNEAELLLYENRGIAKIQAMDLWRCMSERKKVNRDYKNPREAAQIRHLLSQAVCRFDQLNLSRYPISEEELKSFE